MLRTPPPTVLNDYRLIITNTPADSVRLNLQGIDYNSQNAATRYLQVFAGTSLPANTTVPLLSIRVGANSAGTWRAPEGQPFIVSIQAATTGHAPTGIVIAGSSSESSFTVDASGAFDITAWVEEYDQSVYLGDPVLSVAGDLTTRDNLLQVWAEASGPLKLHRIQADRVGISAVAEADDDTITATAHGLVNGTVVRITATTVPGGLAVATDYYVVEKTDDTFKLSATSGGAAINITSDGAGLAVYTKALKYLGIYAVDSPATTSKLVTVLELDVNEGKNFGFTELIPQQVDADGTIHNGCTIQAQTTKAAEVAATTLEFFIKATYAAF